MALFGDIDGQGWALIIAAIFVGVAGVLSSIGAIIMGVVQLWLGWKRDKEKIIRDAETAKKVDGVATALETNTARTDQRMETYTTRTSDQLDVIHKLVNSEMLERKRMYAVKCRAAADDTPSAVNLAEAKAAEEAYNLHAREQAEMERQKGNSPSAPKLIMPHVINTGPITSAELKADIAAVPEKTADELDQRKQSPPETTP